MNATQVTSLIAIAMSSIALVRQGTPTDAEFNDITARSLRLVGDDDFQLFAGFETVVQNTGLRTELDGKLIASVGGTPGTEELGPAWGSLNLGQDGVLQVFLAAGSDPSLALGTKLTGVAVPAEAPFEASVALVASPSGGTLLLSGDDHEGPWASLAVAPSPELTFWAGGPDSKTPLVHLGKTELGGMLVIRNKTGEQACTMSPDEYGNGLIGAWNREGAGRTLKPGP